MDETTTSKLDYKTDSIINTRRGLVDLKNSQVFRHLPQAIIIGTRKSGTRALLRFLEVNPSIKSASSEVHFFDKPQNFKLGLNWYREQMPETRHDQITIEKSPAYFVTNDVPERIKSMNATTKLIIIFRDPVARLISDYSQLVANRLQSLIRSNKARRPDKSSAISGTANVSLFWRNEGEKFEKLILKSDGKIDETLQIVKTGLYSSYLERWLATFPRNQFHFVDGERMIREPYVELQKIEKFLLIKPIIQSEDFVYVPRKGFYCLSGEKLYSVDQSINGTSKPFCLSDSKGRRHIIVRADIIAKLREFYRPYNEYFSSLTGIIF